VRLHKVFPACTIVFVVACSDDQSNSNRPNDGGWTTEIGTTGADTSIDGTTDGTTAVDATSSDITGTTTSSDTTSSDTTSSDMTGTTTSTDTTSSDMTGMTTSIGDDSSSSETSGEDDPTGGEGIIEWQTDHEVGTFADWTVNQGGESEYNSGTGDSTITTEQKRSGSYALEQSVNTTNESGTRMFRWYTAQAGEALPADAYYSAWFYYPSAVTVNNWLMLMGWKTKQDNNVVDNAWFLYLSNLPGGDMQLRLTDKINGLFDESSGVAFPTGQWVRIEAYYQARSNNTGRITVWQNGTQIFDANGYQTQRPSSNSIARQFEVANYGEGTTPAAVTRYVDDLIISTGARIP